jgi:hypothetical protein
MWVILNKEILPIKKKKFILFQIKYSFSCLQCPMVQKNGATGTLKPTPLPALNVCYNDKLFWFSLIFLFYN